MNLRPRRRQLRNPQLVVCAGGLFHYHWNDDMPISVRGAQVRLRGVTEMSSPAFYKTDLQISVDNAPFTTSGRSTFEKKF